MSTLNLVTATAICGAKNTSAMYTSSPVAYLPAKFFSNFSRARKPFSMVDCAHDRDSSGPVFSLIFFSNEII
uniref:Zeta class glutathione S-transferase protein n=1 Tax=Rhizophora mucronata TaxID=61149 RepID=A0A2P2QDK1_RHIMU